MKLSPTKFFMTCFVLCIHQPVSATLLYSGDVLPTPANPSGDFFVGSSGTGSFTINNGSSQLNTNGRVGDQISGNGTALVTDPGSAWTNSAELFIGSFGTGELSIQNGGSVSNTNGKIGDQAGSSGAVTVRDSGSQWTSHSELFIGSFGTGALNIQSGGVVTDTNGKVGDQAGSHGSVSVGGTGSTWMNSSELFVGSFGIGDLLIHNGGSVSNTNGKIGDQTGSYGSVTVSGTGSSWFNAADLFVGQLGSADLTIDDQATVQVNNTARVGEAGTLNLGAGELSALDLQLDGVLNILLSDEDSGLLNIENNAVLGGTLEFSFMDSFVPNAGDSFTFLQAGSATGFFDKIIFPDLAGSIFNFIYENNIARLEVNSVPAPLPLPMVLFASVLVVLLHIKRTGKISFFQIDQ